MDNELVERVAKALLNLLEDMEIGDEYAANIFRKRGEPHCGDCTNMCHTCTQCLIEEYENIARQIIDVVGKEVRNDTA